MRKLRVLIVGAGIGGCTLSLALRQTTARTLPAILQRATSASPAATASAAASATPAPPGSPSESLFEATVFEQAPQIQAVGAGLSLGANGLRVLDGLGLYEKVQNLSGPISSLHTYTEGGRKLRTFDYSFMSKRYGYPMMAMERAELQGLLVHEVMAASESAPVPPILFNKKCISVQNLGPGKGVRVHFEDGTCEVGDVVVGADGVKSAVRSAVMPRHDPHDRRPTRGSAAYSGISCILGITSSVPDWLKGSAYWVLGPGKVYGTWSMGRDKQYWFLSEQELITADNLAMWTPSDALKGMDDMWNWFHPYDAHAMFSRTVRAVKIGFFELPADAPWVGGAPNGGAGGGGGGKVAGRVVVGGENRVVLLGDAAHAMLPTVNQGANSAIEDAAVLARALTKYCVAPTMQHSRSSSTSSSTSTNGNSSNNSSSSSSSSTYEWRNEASAAVPGALAAYAAAREARVRRMIGVSRRTGQWQTSYNPVVQRLQQAVLQWTPQSAMERSMDWMYKYRGPEGMRW
ncbi:hypothetical protein CLOM_g15165 [Closterium sp. NIES-68]|nr:hypothetical protein CLOM_g15165 [Closterium sp. NIES-68]GJP73043.1 hypothetical protein CLOP_g3800 [Closterium sp. NIES-67]